MTEIVFHRKDDMIVLVDHDAKEQSCYAKFALPSMFSFDETKDIIRQLIDNEKIKVMKAGADGCNFILSGPKASTEEEFKAGEAFLRDICKQIILQIRDVEETARAAVLRPIK